MSFKQIIQEKLLQTGNDKQLAKYIQEFLGDNCCQRCHQHSKEPLTTIISFNKSKGNYKFTDLPGANYVLKKFCKSCCYTSTSTSKIRIEI